MRLTRKATVLLTLFAFGCPGSDSKDQTDGTDGPTDDTESPSPTDEVPSDTDRSDVKTVAALGLNDLLLTEIMANPGVCEDRDAEYIEVHYVGTGMADLSGLVVREEGVGGVPAEFQVAVNLLVAPGDRVVLAKRPEGLDVCYGVVAGAGVGFSIDNAGDTISLNDGMGRTFDSLDLRAFLAPGSLEIRVGASLERDDDDLDRWCFADTSLNGSGDAGTPGLPNGNCPPIETDTDTDGPTDITDGPTDTDTDTDPLYVDLSMLSVDDLMVTEFLADPESCDDADGEYIEVTYLGSLPADLSGLVISDSSTGHVVTGSLHVVPGQRLLFARSATGLTTCYGLTADDEHVFTLNNSGGDVIRLVDGAGRTFDEVDFRAWTEHPGQNAWERDDVDTSLWCPASDPIAGTSDLGTPGALNGVCPIDTDTDTEPPIDTDGILAIGDLAPGDLVIEEVMPDPGDCTDPNGEYIELRYHGTLPVDIDGMNLIDLQGNVASFRTSRILAPLERLVLYDDSQGPGGCYGLTGLGYDSVPLNNLTGDVIRLTSNTGVQLDRFDYSAGFPALLEGVAYEKDAAGNWCYADRLIPGSADDLGSPGRRNRSCFGPDTGPETDLPPTDTDTEVGPSDTDIGPSDTVVGPSDTELAPTDTEIPPTDTVVGPSDTELPPTDTDTLVVVLPSDTEIGPSDTEIAPTDTVIGPSDTVVGPSDTELPPTDTDPPDDGITTVDELVEGEVMITELMITPGFCTPEFGQFFELTYLGHQTGQLGGLMVSGSGGSFSLPQPTVMAPGDRLILARSKTLYLSCYFVNADLDAGFAIDPAGDVIRLGDGLGGVFDTVNTHGWTSVAGYSKERDDVDPTIWCDADARTTSGDFASPGLPNGECVFPTDTDTDIVPTDTELPPTDTELPPTDTDTDLPEPTDTDTDIPLTPTTNLLAIPTSSLNLTEFMPSPSACGIDGGQYLELQYTGAGVLDLAGLQISGIGWTHILTSSSAIASGDRFVIARDAAAYRACYGVRPDLATSDIGLLSSDWLLIVHASSGRNFGSIDFRFWATLPGTSWELDDVDGVSWCHADTPSASGDLGTPGGANGVCPIDTDIVPTDTDVAGGTDTLIVETPLTLADLVPADLTITEFMPAPGNCTDNQGEYIEVLYTGADRVNLQGLIVEDDAFEHEITTRLVAEPGQRVLLGRQFHDACYGNDADATFTNTLGDRGDVITLRQSAGGTILDSVDYNGWRTREGRSWEQDDVDPAIWCRADTPMAHGDEGSPRLPNGICVEEIPTDTDTDNATDTVVVPDTDLPSLSVDDLSVGDFVITEFLADPLRCNDADGEFIEVVYAGPDIANLRGLVFSNQAVDVAYANDKIVRPGDRIIVGRRSIDYVACYGTFPDIESLIAIENTGDVLSLSNGVGVTFDSVDFRTWQIDAGVSWERDDLDQSMWCPADTTTISGDFASPGLPNGICPIPPTDTEIPPTDTEIPPTDTDTDIPAELAATDLTAGDLLITEFLADPQGCTSGGEYIEVRNMTGLTVDLDGLAVTAGSAVYLFQSSVILDPDQVALLPNNVGTTIFCFGVTGLVSTNIVMPEFGQILTLEVGATVVDSVDARGWSIQRGISWERDDDDPATWCPGDVPFGPGPDRGTPGALNGSCIQPPSDTEIPPTDTEIPPTDTEIPPTDTEIPPTDTEIPPTDTMIGPTDTETLITAIGVTDLGNDDLTITEFMAAPDNCIDEEGEYFELHYTGSVRANLQGLFASSTRGNDFIMTPLLVDPGDRVIIGHPGFANCYGTAPDGVVAFDIPNSGSRLDIEDGNGRAFDVVDFLSWDIELGISWERDDVDPSTWCLADTVTASGDLGSPWAANGECPIDTDTPALLLEDLTDGDIIVTEVMHEPLNCVAGAEYAEVIYDGPGRVDLEGMTVHNLTTVYTLNQSLIVNTGDRLVFARDATAYQACYGQPADAATGLELDNGSGLIDFRRPGGALGMLAWWPEVAQPGKSTIASEDDPWSGYCASPTPLLNGDFGSPGAPNARCPSGGPTDTDVDTSPPIESDTQLQPTDTDTDVPIVQPDALGFADLILTEIMADPDACSDADGEYLEMVSGPRFPVELGNVRLEVGTQVFTFPPGARIRQGDLFTLARSASGFQSCYGFAPSMEMGLTLSNTGDLIRIEGPTGASIEQVDARAWSYTRGVAHTRIGPFDWCETTAQLANGDFGTPGAPNDPADCAP